MAATHRFYTEACGFELVKGVVGPTEGGVGWAKHLFYDTGETASVANGQRSLIAFWELHDERMDGKDTAISTGLGFEVWVNHLAFSADSLDDLEAKRERWLDSGHDVMQMDHGFCVSVYTMDPNGILVEYCVDTAPYTAEDKAHALAVLQDANPSLEPMKEPQFFEARKRQPAPA